jgi:hypothetical protein
MRLLIALCYLSLSQAVPSQCIAKGRIQRLVSHSDVVVLAEITAVEDVGAIWWSGQAVTRQRVTYRVKEVLKGRLQGNIFEVGHPLYQNSFSADNEKPRLSPHLFKQGNTLLLFLNITKEMTKEVEGTYQVVKGFTTTDVNCGALTPDENLLDVVRKVSAQRQR